MRLRRLFQSAAAAAAALLAHPTPAMAQVRAEVGFAVGYLLVPTSGRPASPTGGVAFLPRARVLLPIEDWLDATYTQSPIVVAPFAAETAGFFDANDVGLDVHPANRHFVLGAGATGGFSNANFCNEYWCFREWGWFGGATVHAGGRIGSFQIEATARLLHAQPTAWTWPGLPDDARTVVPLMAILAIGGAWGR